MKLSIPWIVSRRSVLIAATLDFFICLFLYEFVYQYEYNSEPSRLVSNTFAFFWIVVSYVLGRYEKTRKISFVIISKIVIKSIFLLFLTNTIYLFINWGYPLLFFWNDVNFFNTDLGYSLIKDSRNQKFKPTRGKKISFYKTCYRTWKW